MHPGNYSNYTFVSVWNTDTTKVNLPLLALYRHAVSDKFFNVLCTNFFCKALTIYIAGVFKHVLCCVNVIGQKCSTKQILQMNGKGDGVIDCSQVWNGLTEGSKRQTTSLLTNPCVCMMSILYSFCLPVCLMGFFSSNPSCLNTGIKDVHRASSRKWFNPLAWDICLRMSCLKRESNT